MQPAFTSSPDPTGGFGLGADPYAGLGFHG